jgi:hypothetical protein
VRIEREREMLTKINLKQLAPFIKKKRKSDPLKSNMACILGVDVCPSPRRLAGLVDQCGRSRDLVREHRLEVHEHSLLVGLL